MESGKKRKLNPLNLPLEPRIYLPSKYLYIDQVKIGKGFVIMISEDQPYLQRKLDTGEKISNGVGIRNKHP